MVGEALGNRSIVWGGPVAPVYGQDGLVSLDWFGDIVDKLKEFIQGLMDKIAEVLRNAFGPVLDTIQRVLQSIQDFFSTRLAEILNAIAAIPDKLANLISSVMDRIGVVFDAIVNKLDDIFDRVVNVIGSAISTITSSFVTQLNVLWGKIKEAFDGIVRKIGEIVDAVRSFIGGVVEALKERLGNLVDAVKEFAGRVVEGVKEFAGRVAEAIKTAYEMATEKIKAVLQSIWERIAQVMESLRKRFEEVYGEIAKAINKHVLIPLQKTSKEVLETAKFKGEVMTKVAMGEYRTWDDFVNDITDPIPLLGPIATFVGGLFLAAVVMPAASAALEPAMANLTHLASEKFRPALLSPNVAVTAFFRDELPLSAVKEQLAKAGYRDEHMNVIIETSRPLPSPGSIQEAYLRGFIGEGQHDTLLRKHGYTDKDIALFKQLYRIIPMPADLIRMAVREAFSPDVARRFGQYEDFPEEFAKWAEKQGLDREWAERYWAAHWDLPSPMQGFEMLHRRVISRDELVLLLRALDVMPFWRDKLIQISYNPYTRVDVRRMFQVGVLSEQDVYNAYLDLGYDERKARNLTDFTVRYYTPEDKTELDEYKTITRSLVEQAYRQNVISRQEAVDRLKALGYRDDDIELVLSLVEARMALDNTKEDPIPLRSQTVKVILASYERGIYSETEAKDALASLGYSDVEIGWYIALTDYSTIQILRNAMVDVIRQRYVTRIIDRTEAIVQLSPLLPSAEEQRRLLEKWDVERDARVRKPTEAQFRASFYAGIISLKEYQEELRGLGFDEKYVDMLTQLALKKVKE